MKIILALLFIISVFGGIPALAAENTPREVYPSFSIADYNDVRLDSVQLKSKIVVFLFGGRKEGPAQAELKKKLDRKLEKEKSARVISIGIVKAPAFIPKGFIKDGFRKETKGVETFCDWGGKTAGLFRAGEKGITVIIADEQGVICFRKQDFQESDWTELCQKLKDLGIKN